MNTFYEHHKSSINFVYRCFDRILLNGLIQPFQQPERVIGFFNSYRNAERVTRNCLRDIAQQFQNWLKNRCEKWGVPVLDAETRCVFAPPALTTRRGAGDHLAPFRKYQIHEPANRITLAGGALRCDHKRDVERAYTIDPASKKMANRKRLISIPGRSSIQGRRSTSHPRHSPKLGERPQYSARSLSRCSRGFFETTFKNFKNRGQMNLHGASRPSCGPSGRMKTSALIDTQSEVPGETLGILISTHPDVMAAFVANDAFQNA